MLNFMNMISVFEFTDYKSFLRSAIKMMPNKGRGQINKIADTLGVYPTLVSQILSGDRNFTPEQIYKLCIYFALSPIDSDFLILLVQKERAGTQEFKEYFESKIEALRKSRLDLATRFGKKKEINESDRTQFYSAWINSAVWLYASVKDGQTIEAISKRLNISPLKTVEIVELLTRIGMCSLENGKVKMLNQHIHLEYGAANLEKHHLNWRLKAIQRIEDIKKEELLFTAPISISKKDFLVVREEIVKMIKKATKIVIDSPAEDVACINVDFFWIEN